MQYSETNTFMDGLKIKGIQILLKNMNDDIHSLMKNHAYGFMRVSKKQMVVERKWMTFPRSRLKHSLEFIILVE